MNTQMAFSCLLLLAKNWDKVDISQVPYTDRIILEDLIRDTKEAQKDNEMRLFRSVGYR